MSAPPRQRTAIVTGAGAADGIGFAIARRLVRSGMNIVIGATSDRVHERCDKLLALSHDGDRAECGRTPSPPHPSREPQGVACVVDLTEEPGAAPIIDFTLSIFGRLDVLVNNAGMTSVTDRERPSRIEDIGPNS